MRSCALVLSVVAFALVGCGGTRTAQPAGISGPSAGVVARVTGTSAAGTAFVATIHRGPPGSTVPPAAILRGLPAALRKRLEAPPSATQAARCPFSVSIQDDRAGGLGGGCLTPGGPAGSPTVNCNAGLLTITATTGVGVHAVRLGLSNGVAVTSAAIVAPDRSLAGFYYQVVRGPAPIPRTLTLLDDAGRTRGTLHLPAVVGCTSQPLRFLPGGIRTLATGRLPGGKGYAVVAERYRFLGTVYLSLATDTDVAAAPSPGAPPPPEPQSSFNPQQSPGPLAFNVDVTCGTDPADLLVGLVRTPDATVTASGGGVVRALRVVPIPAALQPGGRLVVGVLPPRATTVTVRSGGRTVLDQRLMPPPGGSCAAGARVVEFSLG